MNLQSIISRYFFLSVSSLFSVIFLMFAVGTVSGFPQLVYQTFGSYFYLDYVGLMFSLLSILLGVSLQFCVLGESLVSKVSLYLSVFFSILCYSCCNSFLFWVFYELSILFLLFLLFSESPYSERYIASWYLLGYVVFTSLPMFLCIIYISLEAGSYSLVFFNNVFLSNGSIVCLFLLSLLFITKIPLFPFHVWLPIVHAEAPSPVSVCLSGYIMKLGVLGLYRFCSMLLADFVFNSFYISVILLSSFVFFMASCRELDGKRWLAFLSLSHIMVFCFILSFSDFSNVNLSYYFCLGHGLSAGSVFLLLWLFYDLSGSRNWVILKSSVYNSSFVRVLCVVSLFTVASVPPTTTFFSEVYILFTSVGDSMFMSFLFGLYLFLGGLVPLFLLGFILGRSSSISIKLSSVWSYFSSISFLLLWSYSLFFFI